MILHFAVLIYHFSMLSRYNKSLRGMRFSSAQSPTAVQNVLPRRRSELSRKSLASRLGPMDSGLWTRAYGLGPMDSGAMCRWSGRTHRRRYPPCRKSHGRTDAIHRRSPRWGRPASRPDRSRANPVPGDTYQANKMVRHPRCRTFPGGHLRLTDRAGRRRESRSIFHRYGRACQPIGQRQVAWT